MGLIEAAEAGARGHYQRRPCTLGQLIQKMPEQDQRDIQDLLGRDPKIFTNKVISQALAQNGYLSPGGSPLNHQIIGRHRRGDCCSGDR